MFPCRNLKKTEPNWREVIIAMSAGASGGNPAAALELAGLCKESEPLCLHSFTGVY